MKIIKITAIVVILGVIGIVAYELFGKNNTASVEYDKLSNQVVAYEPLVRKYAKEENIEEYVPYLLAIMQVESAGQVDDVMQSSESLGLPRNSLKPEESIQQGVKFFAQLLDKADDLDVDLNSVIQAYNYGGGYLDFVSDKGHKHSKTIAESFALLYSNGIKVDYNNKLAINANGGWRYEYGNMFYVEHVLALIVK